MRRLIILLLLTTIINASNALSESQLYTYVGIAIISIVAFQSLAYMVMSSLNNERGKKMALNELKSLIATAVLLVLLYALHAEVDAYANILGVNTYNDFFSYNYNNVYSTYKDYLKKLAYVGSTLKTAVSFTGAFEYGPIPIPYIHPSVGGTTSPMKVIIPYITLNDNIFNTLSNGLTVFHLLFSFTKFLSFVSFKYLIPLGLFMRAFPFFRRTGSTLISIGFVIYFLLPPLLYYITPIIVNVPYKTIDVPTSIYTLKNFLGITTSIYLFLKEFIDKGALIFSITNIIYDTSSPLTFGASSALYSSAFTLVYGGLTLLSLINTAVLTGYRYTILTGALNTFLLLISDASSLLILSTSLVVVIASFFTLAVIRAISLILGGEFFLYGVSQYV